MTVNEITELLNAHDIKPSYQRIKVYEELVRSEYHPTVDMIYQELIKNIPTLSKTTIYNAIKTFVEKGLIKIVAIDNNEMRYDAVLAEHGHFKCRQCHKIYNFEIDVNTNYGTELEGYRVDERQILLKGICKHCQNN